MRLGGKSNGNQKNWRLKFFNDDFTDWIPAGEGIENAITMELTDVQANTPQALTDSRAVAYVCNMFNWINSSGHVIAESDRKLLARFMFNILSDKPFGHGFIGRNVILWTKGIRFLPNWLRYIIQSSYAYMRTPDTYNTADCHAKWENEQ